MVCLEEIVGHFDTFWQRYPKKVNKVGCKKKWAAKKLDEQWESISKFLEWAPTNDQRWKSGYICDPMTFINQERWNDHDYHLRPPRLSTPKPLRDPGPFVPEVSRHGRWANKALLKLLLDKGAVGDGIAEIVRRKNEIVQQAEADGDWEDEHFCAVMWKALEQAHKEVRAG